MSPGFTESEAEAEENTIVELEHSLISLVFISYAKLDFYNLL